MLLPIIASCFFLEALEIPVVKLGARRSRHASSGTIPVKATTLAISRRGAAVGRLRCLSRHSCQGGSRRSLGGDWAGGSGAISAVLGFELAPELPSVAGSKRSVAARVSLGRVVVAVKDDPSGGLVWQTVLILSLGGAATGAGLGLRVERSALVVGDEAVPHLPTLGDAQHRVTGTVLVIVGNWLSAAVAATEDCAGQD